METISKTAQDKILRDTIFNAIVEELEKTLAPKFGGQTETSSYTFSLDEERFFTLKLTLHKTAFTVEKFDELIEEQEFKKTEREKKSKGKKEDK